MDSKKLKILDASAVMRSNHDYRDGNFIISSNVKNEVLDENAVLGLETAINSGYVKVMDANLKYLEIAREAAKVSGDLPVMSDEDIEVLALGIEYCADIASDDYAIQNVAQKLGINCEKTTQTGIKKNIKWVWKCSGCRKKQHSNGVCDICGHEKRRYRR